MRSGEGFNLRQEQLQAGALGGSGLAAQQVQRLDAGSAFIQRGDAGVARQLLHAVLVDIAVATETLQRVVGVLDAPFGLAGLGDRGQEADQYIGLLAFGGIFCVMGHVDQGAGMQRQQTAAFHQ